MVVNSFALSLLSPVLHKMVCGSFRESEQKVVELQDVDARSFLKVFNLWCCRAVMLDSEVNVDELRQLATVADRFQITEQVLALLEETMMKQLRLDDCAELLGWRCNVGMLQLQAAALRLARSRFEELVGTAGFATMEEPALECLLDDDDLVARSEEAVWEAVAGWMRAGDAPLRGRGLLSKIRFGLMDDDYLTTKAVGLSPAEHWDRVQGLATEALIAREARRKVAGSPFEMTLLGPRALADRVGMGVDWTQYTTRDDPKRLGNISPVDCKITAMVVFEGLI